MICKGSQRCALPKTEWELVRPVTNETKNQQSPIRRNRGFYPTVLSPTDEQELKVKVSLGLGGCNILVKVMSTDNGQQSRNTKEGKMVLLKFVQLNQRAKQI